MNCRMMASRQKGLWRGFPVQYWLRITRIIPKALVFSFCNEIRKVVQCMWFGEFQKVRANPPWSPHTALIPICGMKHLRGGRKRNDDEAKDKIHP